MKSKIIAPIMASFMLSFAVLPMSASAAAGGISPLGDAGGCHCGGIRQERAETVIEYFYCEEHKGACDYHTETDIIYYYCSNPNCFDVWDSGPLRVVTIHNS